tara:strand:- start:2146 stop:2550 length:405 start_codon:yes stop_codon:yes gene_type:complete
MKEYFTSWILSLFIIWYALYLLNIGIHKYINIYYLSVILIYGYILFIIIDMNIKGIKYEKTFYFLSAIIHLTPLFILCLTNNIKSKYAFETTIILVMLYLVYLEVNKTDVISVYTDDRKRFTSLNDIINYLDMH